MALQFYGVLDLRGDWLNLSFFWVCRNGITTKWIVILQKRAGSGHVW